MTDINLKIYSRPEVAQHYATIEYLTPCEKFLFEKYIEPGSEVLDLGVGGGRTTPFLSSRAGRYAGVDYSPAMIEHCRQEFPTLNFFEADAADLPHFSSSSFDTVPIAQVAMRETPDRKHALTAAATLKTATASGNA